MSDVRNLFVEKVFVEGGQLKFILGLIMVALSWGFNGEYEALIAIAVLASLDFITGNYAAIITGQWDSRSSVRGMGKFFRYLIYMYVARMVDKTFPVHIFSPMMDTYIAVTEAGSILENFHKLGYPVPVSILNKLKTFHEKKS